MPGRDLGKANVSDTHPYRLETFHWWKTCHKWLCEKG